MEIEVSTTSQETPEIKIDVPEAVANTIDTTVLLGPRGHRGQQGETGPANTLSIGTVTKGDEAQATITGEAPNQTLNLVLPKGDKGDQGETGQDGQDGQDGTSADISQITATVNNNVGIPSCTVTRGGTSTDRTFAFAFQNLKGDKGNTGETGNGVVSNVKISTIGLVDTYRMTYSDGTYTDYTVTNGAGGASSFSDLSGSPYDNENLSTALNDKQDVLTAGENITITKLNENYRVEKAGEGDIVFPLPFDVDTTGIAKPQYNEMFSSYIGAIFPNDFNEQYFVAKFKYPSLDTGSQLSISILSEDEDENLEGCKITTYVDGSSIACSVWAMYDSEITDDLTLDVNKDYYFVLKKNRGNEWKLYITDDLDNLGTAYNFYLPSQDGSFYPDTTNSGSDINGLFVISEDEESDNVPYFDFVNSGWYNYGFEIFKPLYDFNAKGAIISSTGGGGSSVTVENTLDSTSTTNALSANMGRVLNEKIAGNYPALVFDSYSQMVTFVNSASADTFGVGQNIYIKTQEVPDLWVASIEETASTYTYTTDAQFITDLNAGTLQIGYVKPAKLETQKVDLTNYVTNTNYATSSVGGVIRTDTTYAIGITSSGKVRSEAKTYAQYGSLHANAFIAKGTLDNVLTASDYATNTALTTGLATKIGNTDYATTSTGGVIKVGSTTATSISSGLITAMTRTYEQYQSGGNATFIGKGTLENVFEGKGLNNIISLPIGSYITVNCTSSYVPEGCLPCDGTEYSKAQFTDLWTNYLTGDTPKLLTCTYTEYNNDIVAYGQCNKFAVDTVNETFKVPTIKNGAYITQALSDSELGKSYNESLPNIKGSIDNSAGSIGITACGAGESGYTGALLGSYFSGKRYSNEANSTAAKKIEFNASLSSSTYQDNAKVQGENIRARIFVVVATGSINQSQMDWSQWASDLQGKANKSYALTAGFPSNNYINLTLGASDSTYTAPANGWFVVQKTAGAANKYITLVNNTTQLRAYANSSNTTTDGISLFIPAKQGDSITVAYNLTGATSYFIFIYAEGEN